MDMQITPLMVVSALGIGTLSAYLAYKRGRSPYAWFAIGFLFGIFGIFAIFFAANRKQAVEVSPTPIVKIDGPKDKFLYYLDPTQQRQGPVSHDTLTDQWKTGKLDESTYVWHEEMSNWTPLKEILKTE